MRLFSLEQDINAVRADFAFYGLVVAACAGVLWATLPSGHAMQGLAWVVVGGAAWTLAEYALHRFVLHGVQPFQRWHELHHAQPRALIATPTVLTAALFAALVVLPAWWLAPTWRASALVLGVAAGYLGYIVTHHAVHHAAHRAQGHSSWLRRQRRWHALHHRAGSAACYGVSLRLWDHVFGSAEPATAVPRRS